MRFEVAARACGRAFNMIDMRGWPIHYRSQLRSITSTGTEQSCLIPSLLAFSLKANAEPDQPSYTSLSQSAKSTLRPLVRTLALCTAMHSVISSQSSSAKWTVIVVGVRAYQLAFAPRGMTWRCGFQTGRRYRVTFVFGTDLH